MATTRSLSKYGLRGHRASVVGMKRKRSTQSEDTSESSEDLEPSRPFPRYSVRIFLRLEVLVSQATPPINGGLSIINCMPHLPVGVAYLVPGGGGHLITLVSEEVRHAVTKCCLSVSFLPSHAIGYTESAFCDACHTSSGWHVRANRPQAGLSCFLSANPNHRMI